MITQSDIVVLKPTIVDITTGAEYASITLPWTFNRMMFNTGSQGQQGRGLNIAKGILSQEMVARYLTNIGIIPNLERKSYRDDDLFDFQLEIGEIDAMLDLKTVNYYSNYTGVDRESLSAELIADNADYPGPDWRRFFPMLVPHTQIRQDKEVYCFGILSSIDFRRDIFNDRSGHKISAFPYGPILAFFSSSKLCQLREDADQGFFIRVFHTSSSIFGESKIDLTIHGEWNGRRVRHDVKDIQNSSQVSGPYSCIASFEMSPENYATFDGEIQIKVEQNDFDDPILNTSRRNINVPIGDLTLKRADFCNLFLPDSMELYLIGWIHKTDFLLKCRQYKAWIWPDDKTNKYHNQEWSQITAKDVQSLKRAGFADVIEYNPSRIKAGWMKTNGQGGGACSYVFPNIGRNGGVKETNLYVLPKDLHPIEEFVTNY